jgi:LysM repeat protein
VSADKERNRLRVEKKEQVFQKGTKMDMEKVALNDEVLSSIQGGTQLPYEIKSGDTLGELAKKYHCTVEQLCQWNNIKNADQISVGQKLVIKF